MAAIDFDRVPTKVFDTVRRSFAPVCASLEYGRDMWRVGETVRVGVWAINDKWQPVPNDKVTWKIVDMHGAEKASGQWSVSMPEDSVQKLGEAKWKASTSGRHELLAEVRDESGAAVSQNVLEFGVSD